MLATVDRDIITVLGRGPVEIGDDFPRNVGLERLRWDGEKVVDLARLEGFWVENLMGMFLLHCVELPNTYFVTMRYADRKALTLNGGHPRLSTPEEQANQQALAAIKAAKEELARLLNKQHTIYELCAFLLGLISILAIYAKTDDPALRTQIGTMIENNLPNFQALPLQKMLRNSGTKLSYIKDLLDSFYVKIGE